MFGKEKYKAINEKLNRRFEEKKVLIAVHRGVWCGNIIENTIEAYDACRAMGADLFECDLSETTDGVLYMFHDGGEWRVLGKDQSILSMSSEEVDSLMCRNCIGEPSGRYLQRFEQLLEHYTNGELFNVDRSWPSLAKLDEVMQKYPHAISQAVIKTPVKEEYLEFFQNCPNKYMYMPIAYNMEEVKKVLSYPDINVVGVEAILFSEETDLFQNENIRWIHEQGLYYWANAITLGNKPEHRLYAGYEDDVALAKGPEASWGKLIDKGIDILQTDWPYQLYQFRKEKV